MSYQDITNILSNENIVVYDEFYLRRIRWPVSVDAPPFTKDDVVNPTTGLYMPPIPSDCPVWPSNVNTDIDSPFCVNITDYVVDAQVVEQRQKGARDFTFTIADDNEGVLQNLFQYNDTITWYQTIFDSTRPEVLPQRILIGIALIDGIPEAINNNPGVINIRGRDSIKLLMLDNFIGNFVVDTIHETKSDTGFATKMKMTLVKDASNEERLVFIHDTTLNTGAIEEAMAPTFNWSQQIPPRIFRRKAGSSGTTNFVEIESREGAWTVILGDGQVWFNREWFDDKIGWDNGNKISDADVQEWYRTGGVSGTPDPLSLFDTFADVNPKQDIWVDYYRYVLPEDQILFTVDSYDSINGIITLNVSDILPDNIFRYYNTAQVVLDKNVSSKVRVYLKSSEYDSLLGQYKLYLTIKDRKEDEEVEFNYIDIQNGDTGYIGEVNKPETRIKEVLKAAGFQDADNTKPFYIENIEPVFSNYLWNDVSKQYDVGLSTSNRITDFINAETSYPSFINLNDNTQFPIHTDSVGNTNIKAIYMASTRRIKTIYFDISAYPTEKGYNDGTTVGPQTPNFKFHLEYLDSTNPVSPVWTEYNLITDVEYDGTNGFTKSGFLSLKTSSIMQNSNLDQCNHMGLTAYIDNTYESRYMIRLRVTNDSDLMTGIIAPNFAMIRPAGQLQIEPVTIKEEDEVKFWDVLEKNIKPFLPPNYDWFDPGNLNIRCRFLEQLSTANYAITSIENIQRDNDDADLYTDVISQGRKRDVVNLIPLQGKNGTKAFIPYRPLGWNGIIGLNPAPYGYKPSFGDTENNNEYSGAKKSNGTGGNFVDGMETGIWLYSGETSILKSNGDLFKVIPGDEQMSPDILEEYYLETPVSGDPTTPGLIPIFDPSLSTPNKYNVFWTDKNGKPLDKYKLSNIQDTSLDTIIGDEHFHGRWHGTLDGENLPSYANDDPYFDDKFVLAFQFSDIHDIGTITVMGAKTNVYSNQNTLPLTQSQTFEIWKSETTDSEGAYELMIPAFQIPGKSVLSFTSDQFVSTNTKAKFIRFKCISAAKAKDYSSKATGNTKVKLRSAWGFTSIRIYPNDIIREKAILGVDKLSNDYTAADLANDAKLRRILRPRTYTIPGINEYANRESDVKADAIATLREVCRKFTTISLSGCRPDVKVGDTAEITNQIVDDKTIWASMANGEAKELAKIEMLNAVKNFMIEEVSRQSGGKVSVKMTAYRGR